MSLAALRELTYEWPDQVVDRLRRLWLAGVKTQEIAKQLGVSRSAVCGKARRIGLPQRVAGTPRKVHKLRLVHSAEPIIPNPRYAYHEKPFQPLPGSKPTILANITPNACRWPIGGQGADMLCCGQEKARGAYCEEHASVAYVPITGRKG